MLIPESESARGYQKNEQPDPLVALRYAYTASNSDYAKELQTLQEMGMAFEHHFNQFDYNGTSFYADFLVEVSYQGEDAYLWTSASYRMIGSSQIESLTFTYATGSELSDEALWQRVIGLFSF